MHNSTIKQKSGNCIEENCSYFGVLIAKRCQTHYWQYRAGLKKDNATEGLKTSQTKNDDDKKLQNVWFASQILQIPHNCEECNKSLGALKSWKPKIIIAHILPKRKEYGFPSVACHPQNRMFYCWDCHTDFDNKGHDHAKQLKSLPLMRERFLQFKDDLTERELARVPDYLL